MITGIEINLEHGYEDYEVAEILQQIADRIRIGYFYGIADTLYGVNWSVITGDGEQEEEE